MSAQIVTLLFTDLAGSSALLEDLGDDAADEARRTHFSLLREALEGFGGEEVKSLGDGLMVVFPSAIDAVRCAVGIQQAVQRHNLLVTTPEFGVRVGLHVGEPIQDEDDYFGTPVVVAKRLCDSASAGQILASGLVRGLVASRAGFVFRPVGELILKGMTEPVDGFEVVWSSAMSGGSAGPMPDARMVRLVGREDELEQLEDELSRSRRGELRAVLLVGEPGVGKTRLATELARRHATEIITLSARAYPLGATDSLGLWAEGLERHLRGLTRSEVSRLCAGDVDDLAALLPSVRAAREGGDAADPPRIRLLGALARLLGRLSAQAPTVIVLDDVHLADGSSWEALNYLTRNLVDCRILLMLAARPAELAEARVANDVLLGLAQEGLLRRLTLTTLPPDDIRELAESMVGGVVPDALVSWLMERARGSPLFVVGLLRALVAESADLEHPGLRALPEDLAERVEARLGRLDAAARAALELITVVGYRAELSDLVRLSGKALDELGSILERLVRARLVSEIEAGRELSYEIDHPLIQEAIYSSIGGARRRALHRHAARALVEAGRLGAAAPHFVRAADPGDDEAIAALCEALRQAEAGQHHREALALLDALLVLVPSGDRRWRRVLAAMPLQPEWVVDHRADTGAETGVRAMRAIEQVLEDTSSSSARAAIKFNLGTLLAWAMGEVDESRRLVGEARALFESNGETREALLCANELSYLAGLGDDTAGHEARARAVLAAAVESAEPLVELQALCSLSWALLQSGQLEAMGPVVSRAIGVARQTDKAYRTTYLIAEQAWVAAQLGRLAEAHELVAEAKAGNPAFRDTFVLDFTAAIDWLAGELSAVVSAFRDQLAWSGGISRRRSVGAAHAVMALAELGRHAEAAEVQASVDAVFAGRNWWALSHLACWSQAASARLSRGSGGDLTVLKATVEHMTSAGYWNWARFVLADLAEGAVDAGDGQSGTDAGRLAASDPWLSDAESQVALRQFTQGAAALSRNDQVAAAALLEPAAQSFATVGWRLFEGRALALLGRALVAEDRGRAITVLEAAVDRFDASGAVTRRDQVLRTLGRLGTRGRRTKSAIAGPSSLTNREREVALLAAEGRSAKEIAEELFVGERTVETHLAHAYAKLGIGSKLELVRLAAQLDL